MNDIFKNKKNILIAVGGAALVIIVFFLGRSSAPSLGSNPAAPAAGEVTQLSAPAAPESKTRAAAPANMAVPDLNAQAPSNVAVPTVVAPAAPGSDSAFRVFSIKLQNNAFIPDTIVVNTGDIIHLTISAIDKNYDFTQPDFGFKTVLPKGSSKLVLFSASAAGKFTFFCSACGGPSKGPAGYLVIEPKK